MQTQTAEKANQFTINRFLTKTENNDVTLKSTGTACLDLFSKIGSGLNNYNFLDMFKLAYSENKVTALKILFWSRHIRKGAGLRSVFINILSKIVSSNSNNNFFKNNIESILDAGYWKDLIKLYNISTDSIKTSISQTWAIGLKLEDGLAAKWAPRKGNLAKAIRDQLGVTNKQYRKLLKRLSSTVEQQMSNKKWNDIDYSSVPSQAMKNYYKAFQNHDQVRFENWVNDDSAKVNTDTLWPHQIIKQGIEGDWSVRSNPDANWALLDKLWKNVKGDYKSNSILPLCDVSGSMSGDPMIISVALGLFISQRNKSAFQNYVMTFSNVPHLVEIDSTSLPKSIDSLANIDWHMSTNFDLAFNSILKHAQMYNVPQEDMPEYLLVLSDMQFNEADNNAIAFDRLKATYESAGYNLPKIIFWNLRPSSGFPASEDDENVALVSGFSPKILDHVLKCEVLTPTQLMLDAIEDIEVDTKYDIVI